MSQRPAQWRRGGLISLDRYAAHLPHPVYPPKVTATTAAGLPIGLQIIGAPGADAAVLRLAAAYEAATR